MFKILSYSRIPTTPPHHRSLIILVGKCGAGKNYVGHLFTEYGYTFYDGDDDLLPEQKHAIRHHQPISPETMTTYYHQLIYKLREKCVHTDKLVFAQALFRAHHRQLFRDAFPNACFIWIKTEDASLYPRLIYRTNALASKEYALQINPFFSPPQRNDCVIFTNNHKGPNALRFQIQQLLL